MIASVIPNLLMNTFEQKSYMNLPRNRNFETVVKLCENFGLDLLGTWNYV